MTARRPARPTTARRPDRRGAALVEFAVLAPFFVFLVVASAEMNAAIGEAHRLSAALRQAGRLASQDWDEALPGPISPREKVEADVKNFLAAGGTPREDVDFSMTVAEGDGAGDAFELGRPENRLELFTVEVSVPTPGRVFGPVWFGDRLSARLTLRAGRDQHRF